MRRRLCLLMSMFLLHLSNPVYAMLMPYRFLRWRIALMEMGVSKLKLAEATTPIPDYGAGPDPYQGIQVHDYSNVSFLRMDPRAKAASKKTIELLGAHYPETLSRKFFVNVPLVMQWVSISHLITWLGDSQFITSVMNRDSSPSQVHQQFYANSFADVLRHEAICEQEHHRQICCP